MSSHTCGFKSNMFQNPRQLIVQASCASNSHLWMWRYSQASAINCPDCSISAVINLYNFPSVDGESYRRLRTLMQFSDQTVKFKNSYTAWAAVAYSFYIAVFKFLVKTLWAEITLCSLTIKICKQKKNCILYSLRSISQIKEQKPRALIPHVSLY